MGNSQTDNAVLKPGIPTATGSSRIQRARSILVLRLRKLLHNTGVRRREIADVLEAHNATRGLAIATRVTVADTPSARRKGLLHRPPLAAGEALWIAPCESVHTVGMTYPIDLIYLDKLRRVVKVVEDVVPWRISLCLRAHSVIELPAGSRRASGTRVGDVVSFSPSTK